MTLFFAVVGVEHKLLGGGRGQEALGSAQPDGGAKGKTHRESLNFTSRYLLLEPVLAKPGAEKLGF